ncbi:MAG: hypothetical protein AABZ39_02775 [Spirochaetota bacterium]
MEKNPVQPDNKAALDQNAKNFAREAERYSKALELARGDQAKARLLMNPESKDVLNVRLNFNEINLHIVGCVTIFYDIPNKMLMHIASAVSEDKSLLSLSPHTGWRDYKHGIEQLVISGRTSYELLNKCTKVFTEHVTNVSHDEFAKYVDTRSDKKLKTIMESILLAAYGSKNFDVDAASESVNLVDYKLSETESSGKKAPQPEVVPAAPEPPPVTGAVISVKPILSPVKGVIIYQISEGDVIFVHVSDNSPRGLDYLGKMIGKYKADNPKIPAIVKKVEKHLPRVVIYVSLEENLFGKIEEVDPLKILTATADLAETPREVKPSDPGKPSGKSNVWKYVGYAGIAVAAIAVVSIVMALVMS